VTVGTVTQEEFSLGCHSHFDVLFSFYVLLTTVHHTNIPCRGERGRERRGEERARGEVEGEERRREERRKGGEEEGEGKEMRGKREGEERGRGGERGGR